MILVPLLHGCSAMPTPTGDLSRSDEAAVELLGYASKAQGNAPALADVSVAYDGRWLSGLVNRIQPALVDERFRGSSEERLLIGTESPAAAQIHIGEGGTKIVVRRPGSITVARNGKLDADPEALASAALVAEGAA